MHKSILPMIFEEKDNEKSSKIDDFEGFRGRELLSLTRTDRSEQSAPKRATISVNNACCATC
jgi:hypothetical protein